MQRSSYFHRRTPCWCWRIVVVTSALVLPGAGIAIEKNETFSREEPGLELSTIPTEVVAVTQADPKAEAIAALKDLGADVKLNDTGQAVGVRINNNSQITDADLKHLSKLRSLEKLELIRCSQVTDGVFDHLKGLRNLKSL